MRTFFLGILLLSATAQAQIYKCVDGSGKVGFSDRPCASEASQESVEIKSSAPAAATGGEVTRYSEEEIERMLNVEIPASERAAQKALESADPAARKIGEQMAWAAHQQRVAAEEVKAARATQGKTAKKYQDAIDKLNGR